jgi:hypothetical protein
MANERHSRPLYRATMHDINVYAAALRETIAELSKLTELQQRLETAETCRCLFCGGTMRDLAPLIAFGGFTRLGGDYSTLAWASHGTGWVVPERWECQSCYIHDSTPPPEGAQLWDDASPPGKHAFAHVLFEAFPRVTQIAYDSRRGVWYLGTVETWYAATGTREVLGERWGFEGK